ncbi:hypothetical protein AAMO2058_000929100 [Amorphochlora amoebiformis]|uniref:Vesicle transport protein GOT1B n=1 Tax=Amorphochlora amoebiformis TaxID=1561963 RepID=A0A7S0GUZ3_9EUKA|mmetsp:Transcript_1637/g.2322  ORF Transcript_1637/g.2322 Transcript_1637/m.2322 type:complete len:144 (+) Transcript_1637:126-557(+)
MFSNDKKIGIGLTVFGVIFLFLGVIFLFDTSLLTLGNVLFVAGIMNIIGFWRTVKFFFGSPEKWWGTVMFMLGFVLVLIRWPVIGMCVELYGIFKLFYRFWEKILHFLYVTPVIGPVLRLPVVERLGRMLSYLTGRRQSTLPE